MRTSFLAVLGLAVSSEALCPYARNGANTPSPHKQLAIRGAPAEGKKGVFLMNRIGPTTSTLYIANADGSNARKLLGNSSDFDYHGHFSADGQW